MKLLKDMFLILFALIGLLFLAHMQGQETSKAAGRRKASYARGVDVNSQDHEMRPAEAEIKSPTFSTQEVQCSPVDGSNPKEVIYHFVFSAQIKLKTGVSIPPPGQRVGDMPPGKLVVPTMLCPPRYTLISGIDYLDSEGNLIQGLCVREKP